MLTDAMACSTRAARARVQVRILLECNNIPREKRGEGRFVSCSGSDDQYRVGALDRGRLQQPGGDHRLHHVAAAAERQILVDIGNLAQMLGDEKLAPDEREGVEDSLVRNPCWDGSDSRSYECERHRARSSDHPANDERGFISIGASQHNRTTQNARVHSGTRRRLSLLSRPTGATDFVLARMWARDAQRGLLSRQTAMGCCQGCSFSPRSIADQ